MHRRRRIGVEPIKLVIFHLGLMQGHFADIVRCVAFCNIHIGLYLVMKAVNGFQLLTTQRQMTLKDVWVYNVRKVHRPRMSTLS